MLRSRVAAALAAAVAVAVAAIAVAPASRAAASGGAPWFGVLLADGQHAADEKAAHVSVTDLALNWSAYEPQPGVFDSAYIAREQQQLQSELGAGMNVILDTGMQYPPAWVFALDANTRFVNQYGDVWHAGLSNDVPNGVFDQKVRAAQATYITRVAADMGDKFYAIRAGGLLQNELRYPDASYNGHTNSFWAFDGSAQAGSPVPGWIPGQPDTTRAQSFLDYYLGSITGYETWLLKQYRSHFAGYLQLLLPSWGLRPGDAAAAVARNLDGTSNASQWGTLAMGLDWANQVNAIPDTKVQLYNAWMERGDDGTTANTLAPAHYLVTLGAPKGLAVVGENADPADSAATLQTIVQRTRDWGLAGLMWVTEPQLLNGTSGGGYANYGAQIAAGPYQILAPTGSGAPPPSSTPPPTSTPAPVVTPPADTRPPSAPGNLTARVSNSSHRVRLGWTASTDNVGVAGYRVYRNRVLIASATTPAYSDYPGRGYFSYQVVAYDAAGNVSPPSNSLTVRV